MEPGPHRLHAHLMYLSNFTHPFALLRQQDHVRSWSNSAYLPAELFEFLSLGLSQLYA